MGLGTECPWQCPKCASHHIYSSYSKVAEKAVWGIQMGTPAGCIWIWQSANRTTTALMARIFKTIVFVAHYCQLLL